MRVFFSSFKFGYEWTNYFDKIVYKFKQNKEKKKNNHKHAQIFKSQNL